MTIGASVAIFFIIWWTALFAVLPFGVRSQVEEGRVTPGTEAGAPSRPLMLRKVIWTTIVSAILYALFHINYVTGFVTLDDLPFLPRFPTR